MTRIASAGTGLAIALTLLLPGVAAAQQPLGVVVREVSFASGDETRLIVSVTGPEVPADGLDAGAFSVTEQGVPVNRLRVERLFDGEGTQARQVSVALMMDVSRSTRRKLDAAKVAATAFLDGLPATVRASVSSFGATVDNGAGFVPLGSTGSDARSTLSSTIDGLTPSTRSGTHLYDAVISTNRALGRQDGQRNLVIFSDGNDVGSTAKLSGAVKALDGSRTAVTTVLLSTRRIDEGALKTLSGAVKGGSLVSVENASALRDAFASVAQSLSSQYVLSYLGTAQTPVDLDIDVSVTAGAATASDSVAAINERAEVTTSAPLELPEPKGPLVPAFSSSAGLYFGIAGVFVALLLFFGMLLWRPAGQRAEALLARGLRMYTRGSSKKKKKEQSQASGDEGSFSKHKVGRAAIGIVDRLPRPKEFDAKMQTMLDRAGWPLRSTEFILIQFGGVAAGLLLGFVFFQSPIVGVMLIFLGAMLPRLALSNTISRRESAFLEQLPDTLQLLSGSLQAGYGFLQAIDTVAKESVPPTSEEFGRVMAEARLGMPLDDALDGMAERLGSDDFRWVVLAINIQRTVGGNLAQLLTTVAGTLREREQVRRQIKVLSAEGRLSAVILTALPFALVGYLSVINPGYLGELTGSSGGRVALGGVMVLMGLGIAWMRKIIRIDV